jgi:hypothetical protein
MNDLQFAGRFQCLPIRCSGRLMSLQNEHSIHVCTNPLVPSCQRRYLCCVFSQTEFWLPSHGCSTTLSLGRKFKTVSLGRTILIVAEKMRLWIQIKQKNREPVLEASKSVNTTNFFWGTLTEVWKLSPVKYELHNLCPSLILVGRLAGRIIEYVWEK